MTIPTGSTGLTQHTGNGTADTFDYEFKITSASDLLVTLTDLLGVDTALDYPDDYNVSGVGDNNGGSITLTGGALASGYTITIQDNIPLSQLTPFGNQSAFFGSLHEDAFDNTVRLVRRNALDAQQSLKIPVTAQGSNTTLPKPVALNLFRWNEAGTALETVSPDSIATTVSFSNFKVETFVDGEDFTAGTTTFLILENSPGVKSNLQIYFDGVYQSQSGYSLISKTVTFDEAIGIGVDVVEVRMGTAIVATGSLLVENNLSDLSSTSQALVNLGLDSVDNTADENKPISTAAQTALDLKAPIDSPVLTGTPSAPTPSAADNTTKLATTAFVQGKVRAKATSSAYTITSGGLITWAHGLGAAPMFVTVKVKCLVADQGYSIGDEVIVGTALMNTTTIGPNTGYQARIDSTNVYLRIADNASAIWVLNGTTGARGELINSRWELYIGASL